MRVLVTGGAGYIGAVSVEQLLLAGHELLPDFHAKIVADAANNGEQYNQRDKQPES